MTDNHLLDKLLGPDGPELTCDECFEHLDRYVELEHTGRDADAAIPGMRAHLRGCPACAEDQASLSALLAADA
jgi:hypothetical protein